MLRSVRFDIPVVAVGRTRKTPHVDYILGFLQQYYKLGSLGRDYKRDSEGF